MATINRYEDIQAWQKARELVRVIYKITNDGDFARDFGLRDQIRRASVSTMSNIAEGFSRQTDKEFIQFLYIAKGSASEMQSQLYVALDLGYLPESTFQEIYGSTEDTVKLISGFVKYLKSGAKTQGK